MAALQLRGQSPVSHTPPGAGQAGGSTAAHRSGSALLPGPHSHGRALLLPSILRLQEGHQRRDGLLLPLLGRLRRLGLAFRLRLCMQALHKGQVLWICRPP